MVEQFSWLLVSDIHLRKRHDRWEQSVVLRDLVRSVQEHFVDEAGPRFVVVSGDLAFSGVPEEYTLVIQFLDALGAAVRLPRCLFFTVSGNHDITRQTQTTCFAGARHLLTSPSRVDEFLGSEEERTSLLRRLSAYMAFEADYCSTQVRDTTADGLAYVAPLDIDGMPLCLVGLHSTWMCGGDDDQSHLLVGDRPVVNALELLRRHEPLIVLGVMHHPSFWLQEFDRRSIEQRLYPACDVIHHGHLHEPATALVSTVPGRTCLTVAAGAGNSGRAFQNSYTIVTAELARATCRVRTFVYDSATNRFNSRDNVEHPLRLRGKLPGTSVELVQEVATIPDTLPHANYIAALIAGSVSDIPVSLSGMRTFAAQATLARSDDGEMKEAARGLSEVTNLLLTFRDAVALKARVLHVRDRISAFGAMLNGTAAADPQFAAELRNREQTCRGLMAPTTAGPFASTQDYLETLRVDEEWLLLEETAERSIASSAKQLSDMARRYLVIALAHQGDAVKAARACDLALEIVNSAGCDAHDFVHAAVLLYNEERFGDSCKLIKEFANRYSDRIHLMLDIGRKVHLALNDEELAAVLGLKARARRPKA